MRFKLRSLQKSNIYMLNKIILYIKSYAIKYGLFIYDLLFYIHAKTGFF